MSELNIDPRKTVCPECAKRKKTSIVVLDHSSGDLICTSCGLVLEERVLDEGREWRNFQTDGVTMGADYGRERADVGYGHTGQAKDGDLASGTCIVGSDAAAQVLQRALLKTDRAADARLSDQAKRDKHIETYTARVREIANRLSLNEGIVQRCIGLIEDLSAKGELKKGSTAPFFCAVVHLASRQEKATRTVPELAQSLPQESVRGKRKRDDELEKQINVHVKRLSQVLDLPPLTAFIEDEELMIRFAQRLQMSPLVCRPAAHISQHAYKFGLVGAKTKQCSVAAASVFVVAWVLDLEEKPSLATVAMIAKVPTTAVQTVYSALKKHLRYLWPPEFECRKQWHTLPD